MLTIECRGSPFEIGAAHGRTAARQISGSLCFYEQLFKKYTGTSWSDVLSIAELFSLSIKARWPRLHEEMEGVAMGCGRAILDIIALNVRTEIAFGLFKSDLKSDGCTSIAWKHDHGVFLGQNWDWMEAQKDNLVLLSISSPLHPQIKMITEAGIIGKIGLNEHGVGVCLNAIRSTRFDDSRLPTHLALRLALEASSAHSAAMMLSETGLAGSAHIMVADLENCFSMEFTSKTCLERHTATNGWLVHTNHMLSEHEGIEEIAEADSFARQERTEALIRNIEGQPGDLDLDRFGALFDDHSGFPTSVCRAQEGCSEEATIFNITMNLGVRRAIVSLGRLCALEELLFLDFDVTGEQVEDEM